MGKSPYGGAIMRAAESVIVGAVQVSRLPFPFWPVSNGEWTPPPVSPRARAAERLYADEVERRARRLGITRREFVRSAAGTATGFMVLNTVFGLPTHASEAVLPVTPEQCDDPEAALELFDRGVFVVDVQLHHVDRVSFPQDFWGPALRFLETTLSDRERADNLSQANFVKEVFVDSATAVGVISGVPDGVPLPVETMKQTRDLVNGLAGSERALIQAMIDPNHANARAPTALSSLEHQVVDNGAKAIKTYTGNDTWWLDDEKIAYPMYQEALRLGLDVINVHKGFPGLLGAGAEYVTTRDLAKATRDWPQLDFVIYHSGYFQDGTGISGFLADIEAMGPRSNLYGEIGSTFATVSLFEGPTGPAHLIGSLLKALGSWRVVWGTDSIWWGSPQWQIDMLQALQIPESMQEQFGYPPLTDRMKERILGRNASRLYGIDIETKRCELAVDAVAAAREAVAAPARRGVRVEGGETSRSLAQLAAHGRRRARR